MLASNAGGGEHLSQVREAEGQLTALAATNVWSMHAMLHRKFQRGTAHRQRLGGGALSDEGVQRVERVELRGGARRRQGRGARDPDRGQLDADVRQRGREVLRAEGSARLSKWRENCQLNLSTMVQVFKSEFCSMLSEGDMKHIGSSPAG